jgi:hypothetical protein
MGTNPLTFGIPTDEEFPFVIDCATSINQRYDVCPNLCRRLTSFVQREDREVSAPRDEHSQGDGHRYKRE